MVRSKGLARWRAIPYRMGSPGDAEWPTYLLKIGGGAIAPVIVNVAVPGNPAIPLALGIVISAGLWCFTKDPIVGISGLVVSGIIYGIRAA